MKQNNGIVFHPIGIIHSPFTEKKGMPIQPKGGMDIQGTVSLFPEFGEGLSDLAGFSHIILLYHFHQSSGYSLKVTPFLDDVKRGLFATRAPRRPNSIGISVVELLSVEGSALHIRGVDILDGTPLLDIKPHVPVFDSPPDIRTGWLEKRSKEVDSTRSDSRFEQQ